MSQHTRDEILEKIKERQSVAGVNLSGVDLSGADLSKANLSGANLSGSNLSAANLRTANLSEANLRRANLSEASMVGANLIGANLGKANLIETTLIGANLNVADLLCTDFERANLKKANISGANVYHIKTYGWEIEGIKCSHVYQCPTFNFWEDKAEQEKYRQNFKEGEFEEIFRSLPVIEFFFKENFSMGDYCKLVCIAEVVFKNEPEIKFKLQSLEQRGSSYTTVRFSLCNDKFLEKTAQLAAQLYQDPALGQKLLSVNEPENKSSLMNVTVRDGHTYIGCVISMITSVGIKVGSDIKITSKMPPFCD